MCAVKVQPLPRARIGLSSRSSDNPSFVFAPVAHCPHRHIENRCNHAIRPAKPLALVTSFLDDREGYFRLVMHHVFLQVTYSASSIFSTPFVSRSMRHACFCGMIDFQAWTAWVDNPSASAVARFPPKCVNTSLVFIRNPLISLRYKYILYYLQIYVANVCERIIILYIPACKQTTNQEQQNAISPLHTVTQILSSLADGSLQIRNRKSQDKNNFGKANLLWIGTRKILWNPRRILIPLPLPTRGLWNTPPERLWQINGEAKWKSKLQKSIVRKSTSCWEK